MRVSRAQLDTLNQLVEDYGLTEGDNEVELRMEGQTLEVDFLEDQQTETIDPEGVHVR